MIDVTERRQYTAQVVCDVASRRGASRRRKIRRGRKRIFSSSLSLLDPSRTLWLSSSIIHPWRLRIYFVRPRGGFSSSPSLFFCLGVLMYRARIRIIPWNRVDQCFATDSEECERKLAEGIVSSRIEFPLSRRIIDCRGSSPRSRDRVVIVSCNSILHSFTSRKWKQTRMILSIVFSKLYKKKVYTLSF